MAGSGPMSEHVWAGAVNTSLTTDLPALMHRLDTSFITLMRGTTVVLEPLGVLKSLHFVSQKYMLHVEELKMLMQVSK